MSKLIRVDKNAPLLTPDDADRQPVLETHHLGIDFGGLRAVDDFNIAIGRTEIAGNHTDHEGGHVIAAALDRAILAAGDIEEGRRRAAVEGAIAFAFDAGHGANA